MKHYLAFAALLSLAISLKAQEPVKGALPTDLAQVPNDSLAFAHVKLADLWKNDALKDVRAILEKAGAKAIEAFDKRFTPAPSSIDRLTVYLPPINPEGREDFNFVFIVAVNQPYDRDQFIKQLGKSETHKGRLGTIHIDESQIIAVRFIDDKTLAFGSVTAMEHSVAQAPPQKAGPLTPSLELAKGNRPVVLGFNPGAIPAEQADAFINDLIPANLHALFKANAVTLSLDLEGDGHLHATVAYGTKEAADDAEKSLAAAIELALKWTGDTRKQLTELALGDGKQATLKDLPIAAASLMGLGALQHAEDYLKGKPVKRIGNDLTLTVALPAGFKPLLGTFALAAAMASPAVGEVHQQEIRNQEQGNMKQILLAMHNYDSAVGTFPSAAICDADGKRLLSWRVAILPYIEQDNLYKQFRLNEPWDSDHNKTLIDKMPKTYALPNKLSKPNQTHYRALVGNGAAWDWKEGISVANIPDGASNTWFVVESEDGVPWTKPDELEFDPKKELPKFSKAIRGGFHVGFGDGSVRHFKSVPAMAKEMITRAGGEVIKD